MNPSADESCARTMLTLLVLGWFARASRRSRARRRSTVFAYAPLDPGRPLLPRHHGVLVEC
jgi:hypothetical protein